MAWWSPRRPRDRPALRPGHRGEDVRRLQQRLAELGYDPGPADGIYGHQTAEAVRDLERDCRLRVDGIAGPHVMTALHDEARWRLRRSHTVAAGQSLVDAARALQVSPQLLRRALGLPRRGQPVPGQRLVLWERLVAAELKPGPGQAAGLRALGRWAGVVSVASILDVPPPGAEADQPTPPGTESPAGAALAGAVALGLPVWVTMHTRREPSRLVGSYEPGRLQEVLHGAAERERFLQRVRAWSETPGVAGVHLDLGGLRFGDGPRCLSLLRRLQGELKDAGRQLIVSVPLRDLRGLWSRAFNDVDWEAVAGLAAWVVLVPPLLVGKARPPRPPSPAELAGRLRAITRRLPPWRCLLAVPVGALMVPAGRAPAADGAPAVGGASAAGGAAPGAPPVAGGTPAAGGAPALRGAPAAVSWQQAISLAYAARTRPRWDEAAQRPAFPCASGEQEYMVWLENRESLARKLEIVEALRLGGVYLSAVGEEDGRVWTALRERWKVHKPAPE
ncbi:MAG TPA: peptidoglycan-binding protein [Limnochordales bacterium]